MKDQYPTWLTRSNNLFKIISIISIPLILLSSQAYAIVVPIIIPMDGNSAPNGYTCTQINKTTQQCVPIPDTPEQQMSLIIYFIMMIGAVGFALFMIVRMY